MCYIMSRDCKCAHSNCSFPFAVPPLLFGNSPELYFKHTSPELFKSCICDPEIRGGGGTLTLLPHGQPSFCNFFLVIEIQLYIFMGNTLTIITFCLALLTIANLIYELRDYHWLFHNLSVKYNLSSYNGNPEAHILSQQQLVKLSKKLLWLR